MVTERKVLQVVGFDLGFPLSYRCSSSPLLISSPLLSSPPLLPSFSPRLLSSPLLSSPLQPSLNISSRLPPTSHHTTPHPRYVRRFGRVCHVSMPVLTLARCQILEIINILHFKNKSIQNLLLTNL